MKREPMQRREFITLFGGAAAAWPLAAQAQQDGRVRRIGVLDRGDEADQRTQTQHGVMREGLAKLGWIEGRNVRFDGRFAGDDPDRLRAHADELVRLAPDVIAVVSLPATRVLLERTRTIPIVFANVGDPVAGGLLKNIARPEGNATGTTNLFQSLAGKWLELLKEAAPRITRVALIFAADIGVENYFVAIEPAAQVLGVKAIRTPYRDADELERAIDAFAAEPDGGLVTVPPPPTPSNRQLINRLALKYRLPSIHFAKEIVAEGGLMSYGSDGVESFRTAATYVDRILRGAKINELPVQFPTKFELVINLKTAKAIGLTIPETFLVRADEVIE
jgi:putative tryptophan/tyrosine transport system substrate-binding protein